MLNAADEVAVGAFLEGRIPFTGIADVVGEALGALGAQEPTHFEELHAADEQARRLATELVERVAVAP